MAGLYEQLLKQAEGKSSSYENLLQQANAAAEERQRAKAAADADAAIRNAVISSLPKGEYTAADIFSGRGAPQPFAAPSEEYKLRTGEERLEQLRSALEQLPETDRKLFYRRYYYLQPVAQIAAEMGLSRRAAEGRLYRLRQRLRRELGGHEP